MMAVRSSVRSSLRRALSTDVTSGPRLAATAASRRLLLPRKKKPRSRLAEDHSQRVCAHMMGSVHSVDELAAIMRSRFGASSVKLFSGDYDSMEDIERSPHREDVLHLIAPSSGVDAPHGSPPSSIFFFSGEGSMCVSVWWGAEPTFKESMLRDLRAQRGAVGITKEQLIDRLAVPRVTLKWHAGTSSELRRDEIMIDMSAPLRARTLDQLAFSHALHRHMKVLLLEIEVEKILESVKRIVRQGLGSNVLTRLLPPILGGSGTGARTMQRLLVLREFNFDSDVMSTPDWLWEQPEREAMYDALVAEYEIVDRTEAINQQLDYAQVGPATSSRHLLWRPAWHPRRVAACAQSITRLTPTLLRPLPAVAPTTALAAAPVLCHPALCYPDPPLRLLLRLPSQPAPTHPPPTSTPLPPGALRRRCNP